MAACRRRGQIDRERPWRSLQRNPRQPGGGSQAVSKPRAPERSWRGLARQRRRQKNQGVEMAWEGWRLLRFASPPILRLAQGNECDSTRFANTAGDGTDDLNLWRH